MDFLRDVCYIPYLSNERIYCKVHLLLLLKYHFHFRSVYDT